MRKRSRTPPFGEQIEAFKKHLILSRMVACDNNQKCAAEDCGWPMISAVTTTGNMPTDDRFA
jgi:hypothetical protein